MARGAIDGNLALRVTAEAITHIQVHRADGGGLLRHIAMAARAGHSGADVRRMIEANVGRGAVVVYAHPGNILAARLVSGDLFNLGPVLSDGYVAAHAKAHVRNAGARSLRDACMARFAHQAVRKVRFMRESDGLNRRWPPAQKIKQGIDRGRMCRSENAGGWIRGHRRGRRPG